MIQEAPVNSVNATHTDRHLEMPTGDREVTTITAHADREGETKEEERAPDTPGPPGCPREGRHQGTP